MAEDKKSQVEGTTEETTSTIDNGNKKEETQKKSQKPLSDKERIAILKKRVYRLEAMFMMTQMRANKGNSSILPFLMMEKAGKDSKDFDPLMLTSMLAGAAPVQSSGEDFSFTKKQEKTLEAITDAYKTIEKLDSALGKKFDEIDGRLDKLESCATEKVCNGGCNCSTKEKKFSFEKDDSSEEEEDDISEGLVKFIDQLKKEYGPNFKVIVGKLKF
jgi:hypothetical protein